MVTYVNFIKIQTYLNVSRIIVNNTNFPKRGTTNDVGGMISANKRKNTVRDSRIDIERLTCKESKVQYFFFHVRF